LDFLLESIVSSEEALYKIIEVIIFLQIISMIIKVVFVSEVTTCKKYNNYKSYAKQIILWIITQKTGIYLLFKLFSLSQKC